MSAISQRLQPSSGPQNIARPFALVLGVGYLVAGVAGFFVTGFSGFVSSNNGSLLGFHVNIFHNLVHLAIGLILVVASRLPDAAVTQGILFGVGLLYVAATLLGFLNRLPIIAVNGSLAPDNFLHLVSAAFALIGGMLGTHQQAEADQAYLA